MGSYHGPKLRLSRRLGVAVASTPKHRKASEMDRPGMHGQRRGRASVYALQLLEKQKVAAYYNVRTRQLRRYLRMALKAKGSTPEALQRMLEMRLDNVVRRAGWARTIWQARQIVSHGHVQVNGRKVDIASASVRPGDVVTVREKSQKFVKGTAGLAEAEARPDWIEVERNALVCKVLHEPAPGEVKLPFVMDMSLVVELYSR